MSDQSSTTPGERPPPLPSFEKKEIFEAEIRPLLRHLIEVCQKHDLPALFLAQTSQRITGDTGDRRDYESDLMSAGSTGPEDYIPEALMAAREIATNPKLYPLAEKISTLAMLRHD